MTSSDRKIVEDYVSVKLFYTNLKTRDLIEDESFERAIKGNFWNSYNNLLSGGMDYMEALEALMSSEVDERPWEVREYGYMAQNIN
jgi:hypothetical protein